MGPAHNGKGISVNFRYKFTEKMETFKFYKSQIALKYPIMTPLENNGTELLMYIFFNE
jgi:hypothetical protein